MISSVEKISKTKSKGVGRGKGRRKITPASEISKIQKRALALKNKEQGFKEKIKKINLELQQIDFELQAQTLLEVKNILQTGSTPIEWSDFPQIAEDCRKINEAINNCEFWKEKKYSLKEVPALINFSAQTFDLLLKLGKLLGIEPSSVNAVNSKIKEWLSAGAIKIETSQEEQNLSATTALSNNESYMQSLGQEELEKSYPEPYYNATVRHTITGNNEVNKPIISPIPNNVVVNNVANVSPNSAPIISAETPKKTKGVGRGRGRKAKKIINETLQDILDPNPVAVAV